MWKRHSNNNHHLNVSNKSRRKINDPILIDTTFDEKQWTRMNPVRKLSSDEALANEQFKRAAIVVQQQEKPQQYVSRNSQRPVERQLPPIGRLSTIPSSVYSQATPELNQDFRFPAAAPRASPAMAMDDISLSSSPPASQEGVYATGSETPRLAMEPASANEYEAGSASAKGLGLGLKIGMQSGVGPARNNCDWQQQQQQQPHAENQQSHRSHIPIPRIDTSANARYQQHKQSQNRQQMNTVQNNVTDTAVQHQHQQQRQQHTRNISAGPLPWEALGSNSPIASPKMSGNSSSNNNSPQFPTYAFSNSYSASPSPDAFGVVTSIYSTNNASNNASNSSINNGVLKKLGNRRSSPKLGAAANMKSSTVANTRTTSQQVPCGEWKGPSGRHAIMEVPMDRPPAPPAKDNIPWSPVTPNNGKLMSVSASEAPSSSQGRKKPSPIITSGGNMGMSSPITATNTAIPQVYSTPLSASAAAPSSNKTSLLPLSSATGVTTRKPVPTATRVAGLLTPTSPNTIHINRQYGNTYSNKDNNRTTLLPSPTNGNLIVNTEKYAIAQAGVSPSLPLATPTPRSATMLTQWPAVVRAFAEPYSPSSPLAEMGDYNDRNGGAIKAGGSGTGFSHTGEGNDVSPLGSDTGSRLGSEAVTRGVSPILTPVAHYQRQRNSQNDRSDWENDEGDDDDDDDDDSRIEVTEQINQDEVSEQDENLVTSRFSWSTHATGTTRQSSAYSPPASPVPPLPSMGVNANSRNNVRSQRIFNFNNLDIDMNRISNMSESMMPAPLSVGSGDGTKASSMQNKVGTVAPQLIAAQALLGSASATMSSEPRMTVSARNSSLPPGVGNGRSTTSSATPPSLAATSLSNNAVIAAAAAAPPATSSSPSSTVTTPSALYRRSPLLSSSNSANNPFPAPAPALDSNINMNAKPNPNAATTSTTIIAHTTNNIKSKALPLSPPEQLASGDLITTLEAQLDDFRIRRRNIEKCIQKNEGLLNGTATATAAATLTSASSSTFTSTLTSMPTSTNTAAVTRRTNPAITPLLATLHRATSGIDLSVSQRRHVESQIRSFRTELDEIGRSEHEVGIRLHRAWKRHREREMVGLGGGGTEGGSFGWETGIWVRRVTG